MKPRTVAQLKKLIAEGLKKSPDGIARLDVTEDEATRLQPVLVRYRSDGFNVEQAFIPKDEIDESIQRKLVVLNKGRQDIPHVGRRIAVFPRKWKGFPEPLAEQIFHKGEDFEICKDGSLSFANPDDIARADDAAEKMKIQRPNAVVSNEFVFVGKNKKFGCAVRAWKPLDYLQVSFPAYTLAETIGILMALYKRMQFKTVRHMSQSDRGGGSTHKKGEKNHAKIREMFLALRHTPGWTTAESPGKTALLCQIKNTIKPKVCESTIIKACRGLK